MYGLPPDVDLGFLVEAQLLQVCTGENEVILNFDREISIMCASEIRSEAVGSLAVLFEKPREATISLVDLLGDVVASVDGAVNGTLQIRWSSGALTEFLDTWEKFESYTVRHGDLLIVV